MIRCCPDLPLRGSPAPLLSIDQDLPLRGSPAPLLSVDQDWKATVVRLIFYEKKKIFSASSLPHSRSSWFSSSRSKNSVNVAKKVELALFVLLDIRSHHDCGMAFPAIRVSIWILNYFLTKS
ncbi:uncharacterized protein [Coffea arabica]|uniref:Uncharacterized protein isoform X2 n=1 Tax=Coffea arabica TaxID=13443 RepID=A0ABM4WST5_COFAR